MKHQKEIKEVTPTEYSKKMSEIVKQDKPVHEMLNDMVNYGSSVKIKE